MTEAVEEREELEARREFLIRSLEDLEGERDAGNIDDETYDRLHADYTARAAAVLRALDGETVKAPAEAPPVPKGRRALVIGAVVAFAVVAAVVLGVTIAPRLPGQTVTGGVTDAYTVHITAARSKLANDPVGALKEYAAAAKLRPNEPEPPTYIGWIYALSSQGVTDPTEHAQLIGRALQELATAQRADPSYADAYAFDGIVHARFMNDPKGAVPLLQRYLALAPNGPEASAVRSVLQAAQQAAKPPAGRGTTTTTG